MEFLIFRILAQNHDFEGFRCDEIFVENSLVGYDELLQYNNGCTSIFANFVISGLITIDAAPSPSKRGEYLEVVAGSNKFRSKIFAICLRKLLIEMEIKRDKHSQIQVLQGSHLQSLITKLEPKSRLIEIILRLSNLN